MLRKVTKRGPDPEVTELDILREIRLAYAPVSTPKELADKLGISNTAISNKLKRMQEDGLVETQRVGRSRVYWLTDKGKAHLDSRGSESQ